jgi:hypothetical protein
MVVVAVACKHPSHSKHVRRLLDSKPNSKRYTFPACDGVGSCMGHSKGTDSKDSAKTWT